MKRRMSQLLRSLLPSIGCLSRLKIAQRLGIGFGLVLSLMLATVAVALWQLDVVSRRLNEIAQTQTERLDLIRTMHDQVGEMYTALISTTVLTEREDVNEQLQIISKSLAGHQHAHKSFATLTANTADSAAIRDQLALIRESEANITGTVGQLQDQVRQDTDGSQRATVASLIANTLKFQFEGWLGSIAKLAEMQAQAGREASMRTQREVEAARRLISGVAGVALLIGVLATVLIARSVVRPIGEAVHFARQVAQGDLTVQPGVSRGGEVAVLLDALSTMQAGLRELVHAVHNSTQAIVSASSGIAEGTSDLSRHTDNIASALQRAVNSMGQISGTVQHTAESSRKASELAGTAADAAHRGGDVVSEVVVSMGEISSSSRQISDILGVIDGIAFQTNILALNAAVEAARAGEQGRGFAVVASEVRSLAQRSATAAKEIKTLITSSVETIASGSQRAAVAGGAMEQIVGGVQRVKGLIEEITAAAVSQSADLQEVSASVGSLDQMTQRNAELVTQTTAAADSLRHEAVRLQSLVGRFQIGDEDAPKSSAAETDLESFAAMVV